MRVSLKSPFLDKIYFKNMKGHLVYKAWHFPPLGVRWSTVEDPKEYLGFRTLQNCHLYPCDAILITQNLDQFPTLISQVIKGVGSHFTSPFRSKGWINNDTRVFPLHFAIQSYGIGPQFYPSIAIKKQFPISDRTSSETRKIKVEVRLKSHLQTRSHIPITF